MKHWQHTLPHASLFTQGTPLFGPNAQRCEKDPGRVPSHTTLPSVPRRPLGAQNGLLGAGGWVFLVKNRGRFGTPYTRLAAASCGLTHTVAHMTRLHVSVRRMHLVECQCVQAYKRTLAHASLFTQGTPLVGPNAQRCEKDPGRVPSHTTLPKPKGATGPRRCPAQGF